MARRIFPWTAALLTAFLPVDAGAQDVSVPLGDLLGVLKTVEVRIADRPATMILDTGGGVTVVTPEFAHRIGCEPWGQLNGFRMSGERLTMTRCPDVSIGLAGVQVSTQEVGVFDLTPLLPADAPKLDGILSLDALAERPFTLELEAGRLTLETPASLTARTAGAVEIPIRLHRQVGGASLTVMARVETEQGPLWMQLDAGSDAPLQIPPSSATALGLDPSAASQAGTISLQGEDRAIEATARTRVRDMIIDGNIGIPVLRTWIMTFDLARSRLWITPIEPQA